MAALVASGMAPSPADAETLLFSGVCTLTIEVRFSAPVQPTPASRSASLGGSGTCVVNGAVATGVLQGVVATTPLTGGYSCAAGVATGTGVVSIATPGFPDPVVQLTVVEIAGVVELVVLAPVTRFDGVASLARDANETAACASTGYTRTTWTGVMPFQDPYPPPV